MKIATASVLSVGIVSTSLGQVAKSPDPGQQTPTFLSGRQMDVVCAHRHTSGDAGSTILYNAKEIDSDKLEGTIHIGRLTAIVVRFTHVNTFCYDYEAGVTKQVSFYGGAMPTPLKSFFVGPLPSVFLAEGQTIYQFDKDQRAFTNHYNAYGALGQLAVDTTKAFADSVDPKLENTQIRTAFKAKIKAAFGYKDRDVTKEDFTIRQTELENGLKLLMKDLAALRNDVATEPDSTTPPPPDDATLSAQKARISADEEAVSVLSAQLDNYSTAITDMQQIEAAPDSIEKVIMLDPKYDRYVVTAAVALLKPKATQLEVVAEPATTSSSITIDITGGAQLDFSVGLVATHPVTHDYFVSTSGTQKIVNDGGARDPAYVPAVFVSYYIRPRPGSFAIGPAFGVDLQNQDYFFGLSIVRAGAQRVSLIGGFSLNRLTLLNGDHVGSPLANGQSIQYKSRYVGGYFLGLTFNLGG